jgi:hypothetical protein
MTKTKGDFSYICVTVDVRYVVVEHECDEMAEDSCMCPTA